MLTQVVSVVPQQGVIDTLSLSFHISDDVIIPVCVCVLWGKESHRGTLVSETTFFSEEGGKMAVLLSDFNGVEPIPSVQHRSHCVRGNRSCLLSRWDAMVGIPDTILVERLQIHSPPRGPICFRGVNCGVHPCHRSVWRNTLNNPKRLIPLQLTRD